MGIFEQIFEEKSFKEIMEYHAETVPGGILFHYTDEDGLKGILGGRRLRLTRCSEMCSDEGCETVELAMQAI